MSDGELVRLALAGRAEAYEELVRRHAPRVTALCHARVGRAAAEDLAQEALLRALRALPTLHDPDKFASWLCGIAVRICLDWFKSKARTHVPFSALGADRTPDELLNHAVATPEPDLDREDDVRRLLAEVEGLPEECREVVMLYYYQDVTYRDVAETLGVSAATVNARLTRARLLLRQRLSGLRR
jgi:RNA polymerase sigma-70 factor (ECF subfamily)